MRTYVALMESEDVVRGALAAVDINKLFPPKSWPFERPPLDADGAFLAASEALKVRYEPQSDLLEVSFVSRDRAAGVAFVRALVQKFKESYYKLYTNSDAVYFFRGQHQRAEEQLKRATDELAALARDERIFKIEEQQRLLLEQRSKVSLALAQTNDAIEDKTAQAKAIPLQLSLMKPVNRLPQVTGLTQSNPLQPESKSTPSTKTKGKGKGAASDNDTAGIIDRLSASPPILLVRVYQDTIANLVKLQTDLEGLRAAKANQEETLQTLNSQLEGLSRNEAKYETLKVAVKQARQSSELFAKRALEEQLAQDLNARDLSTVREIQEAKLPLYPIWPRKGLFLLFALCLIAAPAAFFVLYRMARGSTGEIKAAAPIARAPAPEFPKKKSGRRPTIQAQFARNPHSYV